MTAALARLDATQARLLSCLQAISRLDYNRQYHPDLSPLGWHLGHCVFTDNYWLREVVLGEERQSDELRELYVPEFSPKDERAGSLPATGELFRWARRCRADNLRLLEDLLASGRRGRLLEKGYIVDFLDQHYSQHIETCRHILVQGRARHAAALPGPLNLKPAPLDTRARTVPAGEYRIGAEPGTWAYDNEYPAFRVRLEAFRIALRPASNAEYLGFMLDGGYRRPELWSPEGWRWRQAAGVTCPEHWRAGQDGWYGIELRGTCPLAPEAPVHGLSRYEARAFATWAGGRLPHEYEWEAARRLDCLGGSGQVWEWCANTFHPYAGFQAFPYDGYSTPYFDGRHFTLRGGSDYTCAGIRRPSFRNWFEADKRHMHAGLRLVHPDTHAA